MTTEDITRMAREAGLPMAWVSARGVIKWVDLERFAALVTAAEREACARVCDELAELNRVGATDSMWQWGECAAAIRARGNI